MGPLLWAIPLYHNSLVFHSLDKFYLNYRITSINLHFFSPLMLFVIRWVDVKGMYHFE